MAARKVQLTKEENMHAFTKSRIFGTLAVAFMLAASPARSAADPRSTRTTSAPIPVRGRSVRPSERLDVEAGGASATTHTPRISP
jgi:hypothetical protein